MLVECLEDCIDWGFVSGSVSNVRQKLGIQITQHSVKVSQHKVSQHKIRSNEEVKYPVHVLKKQRKINF